MLGQYWMQSNSKVSPQMNAAIHSGRLETMWREEQED